ncbi:transaldolase [Candidatus Manganitrophus noduliformans]|uniref:Transaldolase n=1 Tax=Candidatus Manganitrophus noduliformans TaxID=2606439 RepID=A0A7X6DUH4_9BACT|nr:transaldolase [Candidatus Manganitrophus noduliformans]NKE73218.1 transaldolase [Candidatus Manganitrophus noduliformans]
MKKNPIKELQKQGQSLWLDNVNRALITSGALQRLIDEGLTGLTSNPTIFEKAIGESADYDGDIRRLVSERKEVSEIIDALTIKDIQMAADLFRPIYERTNGADGFVSIELNPALAHQTVATIAAAKALHPRLDRPNVMIKVPATEAGIPAIEALTAEGISINITLLFSLERYEQVASAYIAGIKSRLQQGRPVASIRSVASVFVSRIDTAVDRLLEAHIQEAGIEAERAAFKALLGKAGIANSKMIYQKFKEIFQGPDFLELQKQGVSLQRVLWGSTGTKNPNYPDLLYVEALIGQETINTVPPATLAAFKDHGKVRPSLEENLGEARETLQKLSAIGIHLRRMTHDIQEEGVKSFSESFEKLFARLAEKRRNMLAKKIA